MACIKKLKIDDEIYEVDVEFRNILKANNILCDETIGDYERFLGFIYTLFGAKGLNHQEHQEKLVKWANNYITRGREPSKEEPDMDFNEDMAYIEASFMSDYKIDLTKEEMDWEKFDTLINGLSNSEMGNCCVLNRIRALRTYDTSKIKDPKEKAKIEKAKQRVALKKHRHINRELTEEQIKNIENYYRQVEGKE